MENIFNFGPRQIQLDEIDRKSGQVVTKPHNVRILSEGGLNSMMEHGKTGMVIISACRSEIDSENPAQSLREAFEDYVDKVCGGMQSVDSDALYDLEKDWLKKRNAHATKQLKEDIMAAGYSFTPVYGGYQGKEVGDSSFEPSFVVYNHKRSSDTGDWEELKRFALDMCGKYKQESVYVQAPGEPPVYLDSDGNQINTSSSKDFKFNRESEPYFTTDKLKKRGHPQRFTADISFNEMYIPLKPASLNEQMRRDKQGEIIL